jgi:hypothetical protein
MNLKRGVLMLVAGGFFMLLVDVRHMHREVLSKEWQAWIPIAYASLAIVAALVASSTEYLARPAALFFAAGIAIGAYGSLLHSEGKVQPYAELVASGPITAAAWDGDEEGQEVAQTGRERSEEEKSRPVLAPLALAGLSAFALVALLSAKQQREASL